MSDTVSADTGKPALDGDLLFIVLANRRRRAMLAELCDGEPMGSVHMAAAGGCTTQQAGKHAAMMAKAGLIVRGRGNLYKIVPGLQPVPGKRELELGWCLLRLGSKPAE